MSTVSDLVVRETLVFGLQKWRKSLYFSLLWNEMKT